MPRIPYASTLSTISHSVVTAKKISTVSAVCPVRTSDSRARRSKAPTKWMLSKRMKSQINLNILAKKNQRALWHSTLTRIE